MKQYCRYCIHMSDANYHNYCEIRHKCFETKKVKSINHCKEFEFSPIDVYDARRVYKPSKKSKNIAAVHNKTQENILKFL